MADTRSRRIVVALLTSVAGALILSLFIPNARPLAFFGWVVFFASLQYAYVFPEHGARCLSWLRRAFS